MVRADANQTEEVGRPNASVPSTGRPGGWGAPGPGGAGAEGAVMKCPNDGATLLMAERRDVPIDYCPECRGIWLERGKLERLLDQAGPDNSRGHRHDDGHEDSADHSDAREHGSTGRRRKGVSGMLGDLLGGGD